MTTQETEESTNWRERSNSAWDDKDYRDENWLRQMYVREELSGREIGDRCSVCADTIYKWLKKHNIDRRGKNEGRRNWIDPSDELIEAIEGLLLGDGYLGRPNENGGVYYQEWDKHKEYIFWLKEYLGGLGLDGFKTPLKRQPGYRFTSSKVMDFIPLREKWYPDGDKQIPDGFKITPTKMYFWFVGDGFYSEGEQQTSVGIAGYDLADKFDMICKQLRDQGITCEVHKQGIGIWKESHDDFMQYIHKSGVEIPDGYEYKLLRDRDEVDRDDYAGDGGLE